MGDEKSIKNEADHLFNMIKCQYGDRLTPEELAEVHPRDEPFLIFTPYRKEP